MRALDFLAAIALWGPTRFSLNGEVLCSTLTAGHRIAPSWQAQYQWAVVACASIGYHRHGAGTSAGSAGGAS